MLILRTLLGHLDIQKCVPAGSVLYSSISCLSTRWVPRQLIDEYKTECLSVALNSVKSMKETKISFKGTAEKIMSTIFLDAQGVIRIDFLPKEEKVNKH